MTIMQRLAVALAVSRNFPLQVQLVCRHHEVRGSRTNEFSTKDKHSVRDIGGQKLRYATNTGLLASRWHVSPASCQWPMQVVAQTWVLLKAVFGTC
eukprot:6072080-Pleurochrysis_carterae.AAC.1